jgi:ankyrin repeat protein
MIKLLLATESVDQDSKADDGQTPLVSAAEYGKEAVLKLFLAKDGVDPNSKYKYGRIPLKGKCRSACQGVSDRSKSAKIGNHGVLTSRLLLLFDARSSGEIY